MQRDEPVSLLSRAVSFGEQDTYFLQKALQKKKAKTQGHQPVRSPVTPAE
jgi:hypothetical protein